MSQTCPIGSPERRIIGHELASDAVSNWQPVLCASGGALYSYTQLSDDTTRELVLNGSTPSLGLVTDPIPPTKHHQLSPWCMRRWGSQGWPSPSTSTISHRPPHPPASYNSTANGLRP